MNTYILAAVNILVLFAFFNAVSSLTCLKCEESSCRNERSLMCRGGTTTDPCGCCTVCAKLEGEKCGGPWNIGGVCDRGLVCEAKSDFRTGICRDPNVAKRLPKCSSPTRYHRFRKTGFWSRRRHSRCRNVETTFCNRSCRRCCTHPTTCNPNTLEYIPKTRCQKQRRLYAPKHLFTKDQQDENDVELESLENDIKG